MCGHKLRRYERCAVASHDVCVEPIIVVTCNVRAYCAILGLRSVTKILHIFGNNENLKLEFAFFWCKLLFCSSKMEDFSNFSQKKNWGENKLEGIEI